MNKVTKILAIVAIVLVVVFAGLVVAAKFLITPERVRETVLPLAQDALHRQIELGDIEVSIFSGILLKDVAVKDVDPKSDFISADQVSLRYQFLPLLFLRVVVDEVRLEAPRIRVTRLADGQFNFSDLVNGAATTDTPANNSQPQPDSSTGGAPLDLLVSSVLIQGGELEFLDYQINPDAPYRYKIDQLSVKANNISLQKTFPIVVEALVNGAPLQLKGEANLQDSAGKLDFSLKNLDVTQFLPYFKEQLPGRLDGMKVNLELKAEGNKQTLASKGVVTLADVGLVLNDMPDMPIQGATVGLDYDVRLDLAADMVELKKTTLSYNGLPLTMQGKVTQLQKAPSLDMELGLDKLDLHQVVANVPPKLANQMKDLRPSGQVDAKIHLAGPVSDPMKLLQDGEIRLQQVGAEVSGVHPELQGIIALQGDSVKSKDLQVQIGENKANIDLQASNLFGKTIKVVTNVTSQRFLIDPLLAGLSSPAAGGTAQQTASSETPPVGSQEIGPFDIPLQANGSVQVKQALYKGLTIDDFEMRYSLVNNILTVETVKGKMAGGTFEKSARVDLGKKGLEYTGKVNLQGIQADAFVNAFFPQAAGLVSGTLNLKTDLNGHGTLPETLAKALTGNGDVQLLQGQLSGAGLAQGFASYLNLDELKVLKFQQLLGNFRIENGKVKLDSNFTGKDVKMAPTGTVGLDGSVDLSLNGLLAPQLAQKLDKKGQFAALLTNADGWTEVPLKVSGSYLQPKFLLDTTALKSKAKEKAEEKVQQLLEDKLLKKSKTTEGEETPSKTEPAKQLLDQTLKGFLGR